MNRTTMQRELRKTVNAARTRDAASSSLLPKSALPKSVSPSRVPKNSAASTPTDDAAGAAVRALFQRYRRSHSLKLRDQLIERYRSHVESIARATLARLPRRVDLQDLVHAGIFGLIQAIEGFEPERGAHFVSFMRPRVRGAILDELRQLDNVPRQQRARQRNLEAARLRLREELSRDPSDNELAGALGISEAALRRRYMRVLARISLPSSQGGDVDDGQNSFDGVEDEGLESPIEALHRQELLEQIKSTLEPLEWSVLRLHYLEGLTGKQVALKLRLSAARICQIHLRVLARLKDKIAIA